MFPERIGINVTKKGSGQPIPRCAINVTIFANRKNNYGLLLFTDETGKVKLTKEMVEKEISDSMNMFIMDYASGLSDCSSTIQLDFLSSDEISFRIKGIKTWLPILGELQGLINQLSIAENAKYHPCFLMFDVETGNQIHLEVEPIDSSRDE